MSASGPAAGAAEQDEDVGGPGGQQPVRLGGGHDVRPGAAHGSGVDEVHRARGVAGDDEQRGGRPPPVRRRPGGVVAARGAQDLERAADLRDPVRQRGETLAELAAVAQRQRQRAGPLTGRRVTAGRQHAREPLGGCRSSLAVRGIGRAAVEDGQERDLDVLDVRDVPGLACDITGISALPMCG